MRVRELLLSAAVLLAAILAANADGHERVVLPAATHADLDLGGRADATLRAAFLGADAPGTMLVNCYRGTKPPIDALETLASCARSMDAAADSDGVLAGNARWDLARPKRRVHPAARERSRRKPRGASSGGRTTARRRRGARRSGGAAGRRGRRGEGGAAPARRLARPRGVPRGSSPTPCARTRRRTTSTSSAGRRRRGRGWERPGRRRSTRTRRRGFRLPRALQLAAAERPGLRGKGEHTDVGVAVVMTPALLVDPRETKTAPPTR